MASFSNEVNKITNEIAEQIKDLTIDKVPSIIIKSLILANKINGLNDEDKKEICIEVIMKLIDDTDKVDEYLPLIHDLLENLVKQESFNKISDRSKCKCNCCEVITCKLSAWLKPSGT